jgi:acylphosphatase
MNARLEASVYGRVQMVMFRDFVTRKARGLGVVGEVQNMSDGSVVVVAEGKKEDLDALLVRLHKGPLLAKVEHVNARFMEPSGGFTGFHIIYE